MKAGQAMIVIQKHLNKIADPVLRERVRLYACNRVADEMDKRNMSHEQVVEFSLKAIHEAEHFLG